MSLALVKPTEYIVCTLFWVNVFRHFHTGSATNSSVPAAYVRAAGLAVERLEQTYARTPGQAARQCFDYSAPAFDFSCRLVYDESGLVADYPGIAVRAA